MLFNLDNYKQNAKDHTKDYAKVSFLYEYFQSFFSFNTIVMDIGSDDKIFTTLCNNLHIVSL
jgi:hypothetical protein